MKSSIRILLIEDNPGDIRLVQEAIKEFRNDVDLTVARDGLEALELLRQSEREGSAPQSKPDLILLDLNLPRMNGHELLSEIKGEGSLRRIPVVVLSASCNQEDLLAAYDRHANCYIAKPLDLDAFLAVMSSLENFWFSAVQLPGR